MILYRMEIKRYLGPHTVEWFGTQADLRKALTQAKRAHDTVMFSGQTEVPTAKQALLAWLNECCNERSET